MPSMFLVSSGVFLTFRRPSLQECCERIKDGMPETEARTVMKEVGFIEVSWELGRTDRIWFERKSDKKGIFIAFAGPRYNVEEVSIVQLRYMTRVEEEGYFDSLYQWFKDWCPGPGRP